MAGLPPRQVPIHPQLRTPLTGRLDERPAWKNAAAERAPFLNHRGGRLSPRAAHARRTAPACAAPATPPEAADRRGSTAAPVGPPDSAQASQSADPFRPPPLNAFTNG